MVCHQLLHISKLISHVNPFWSQICTSNLYTYIWNKTYKTSNVSTLDGSVLRTTHSTRAGRKTREKRLPMETDRPSSHHGLIHLSWHQPAVAMRTADHGQNAPLWVFSHTTLASHCWANGSNAARQFSAPAQEWGKQSHCHLHWVEGSVLMPSKPQHLNRNRTSNPMDATSAHTQNASSARNTWSKLLPSPVLGPTTSRPPMATWSVLQAGCWG